MCTKSTRTPFLHPLTHKIPPLYGAVSVTVYCLWRWPVRFTHRHHHGAQVSCGPFCMFLYSRDGRCNARRKGPDHGSVRRLLYAPSRHIQYDHTSAGSAHFCRKRAADRFYHSNLNSTLPIRQCHIGLIPTEEHQQAIAGTCGGVPCSTEDITALCRFSSQGVAFHAD